MNDIAERLRRLPEEKLRYHLENFVSHWVPLRRLDSLVRMLTALPALETMAELGLTFQLPSDLDTTAKTLPAEHPQRSIVRLLGQAIAQDLQFLERHPGGLFQCLWNTCWWYDCPQAAEHYEQPVGESVLASAAAGQSGPTLHSLLEAWLKEKQERSPSFVWLRSLKPPLVRLGSPQRMVLRGHSEAVHRIRFSGDGHRLVSMSYDGTIRVCNAEDGQVLLDQVAAIGYPCDVVLTPSGGVIAVGIARGNILQVTDIQTGKNLQFPTGHEEQVEHLAVSPDGRYVVSGSRDGVARLFDTATGDMLRVFGGHKGKVSEVAFSADGLRIATAGEDGTVRVWEPASGSELIQIKDIFGVSALALSSDGQKVLCGDFAEIAVFDVSTGCERIRIVGEKPLEVTCLSLSPDGQAIVSGSRNGEIHVWDILTGQSLCCCEGHTYGVECVAMASNGESIASGSEDTTVRLWNTQPTGTQGRLQEHSEQISCLSVFNKGRMCASGSHDGTVRLWNMSSGKHVACLKGHKDRVGKLLVTEDCDRLVSCSDDKTIRVWDVLSRREILLLRGHEGAVNSVDISSDGQYIVSGSDDETVCLWDTNTGDRLACLEGHRSPVESVSFSFNGRMVVSGAMDNTARLWNLEARKRIATIRSASQESSFGHPIVRFLHDDRRIVALWPDNTVRVWAIDIRQETACLDPQDTVVRFATSKNGRRIIADCKNNVVQVWDADSLAIVDQFAGFCLGEGDLDAIEKGPEVYPWRAQPDRLGTSIIHTGSDLPVAWCSCRNLSMLADGRTWVGTDGRFLHGFTLEGTPRLPGMLQEQVIC